MQEQNKKHPQKISEIVFLLLTFLDVISKIQEYAAQRGPKSHIYMAAEVGEK